MIVNICAKCLKLNFEYFDLFLSQFVKVKHIDTKQSNKRNNQNSKSKRQDYNM